MKSKNNLTEEQQIIQALNAMLGSIFKTKNLDEIRKFDENLMHPIVDMMAILANYCSKLNLDIKSINKIVPKILDKTRYELEHKMLVIEINDLYLLASDGCLILKDKSSLTEKEKEIINNHSCILKGRHRGEELINETNEH